MVALQLEKPPVYGAVKGAPVGLAGSSPWTQAQRTAGMRREIPLGSTGIGTNRVAPPPPPIMPIVPNRANLAAMLSGRSGAYDMNTRFGGSGVPGGYTTSAGYGNRGGGTGRNFGGGSWGYTPSGTRSSAYGPGGWGAPGGTGGRGGLW